MSALVARPVCITCLFVCLFVYSIIGSFVCLFDRIGMIAYFSCDIYNFFVRWFRFFFVCLLVSGGLVVCLFYCSFVPSGLFLFACVCFLLLLLLLFVYLFVCLFAFAYWFSTLLAYYSFLPSFLSFLHQLTNYFAGMQRVLDPRVAFRHRILAKCLAVVSNDHGKPIR